MEELRITSRDTSHGSGGESTVSRVGSMGSTDHANEEDFTWTKSTEDSKAFVGQSSEEMWVQRLETELSDSFSEGGGPYQSRHNPPEKNEAPNFHANPYPGDTDTSTIGTNIDPYGVPIKSTADALVNAYFASVHPSFPIVIEAPFWGQYHQYYETAGSETFDDRAFLAKLQIILAIGAVHAHMINAEWVGDYRDHLLYFARARVLSVEMGVLNDSISHGQVQIFGLSAMYFVVTDQFNR